MELVVKESLEMLYWNLATTKQWGDKYTLHEDVASYPEYKANEDAYE